MSTRTKWSFFQVFTLGWIVFLASHTALAQGVQLYTPYTKISVPPGESIDYTVDIFNNSNSVQDLGISLSGLPDDWEYSLKSGGWNIERLAVPPKDKKSFTFQLEVPLQVEKGRYNFKLVAPGYDQLPLSVTVSEKGTFKSEFTSDQPNMEGQATASFTFNTNLKNSTAEAQTYSLRAKAPRGWMVAFKPNFKQATSVTIEPNRNKDISIDVKPPHGVKAGSYNIPVQATTASTTADLNLEVVVTGSYELQLKTPKEVLSSKLTAGSTKRLELKITNSGSSPLTDIELNAVTPSKWEVVFDPEEIPALEPGQTTSTYATIEAYDKAIAGDYMVKLQAKTPETSISSDYRISVRTSWLSGSLGLLVILAAIGSVYYLFRKYGRR